MIKIANAQLWVHDQDEALAFYTQKLGMEVRADTTLAELGDFRWLTVSPPGQEDVSITLMAIPGAPVMDDASKPQVEELVAKGRSPKSGPPGSTPASAIHPGTASG